MFPRLRLFMLGAGLVLFGCGRSPQAYLDKGNEQAKAGKYEDAVVNYRKAIQKDPKLGEAYYQLGLVLIEQRNIREAYAVLSQAATMMPQRDEVKEAQARTCLTLFQQGDRKSQRLYDQLRSISEKLLKKNPNSYPGLRIKGQLAGFDGKPNEAVAAFQQADRAKPKEPENVLNIVQGLIATDRQAEGEKLALDFLKEKKDFGLLYDALYGYYADQHRLADGENLLKTKVANLPKSSVPLLQLAGHYLRTGKKEEMKAALERVAGFPMGRLQTGDFYQQAGLSEDALREYQAGEQANPKEGAYRKRVLSVLMAQNKRVEALALADRIVAEDPKDEEIRYARAVLLTEGRRKEQIATATKELKTLVEAKPDNAVYHYGYGRALLRHGETGAAQKQFHEAVAKHKGYLQPRYSLAEVALSQENHTEALTRADEILSLSAENPRGLVLRAAALMGLGRLQEAGGVLTGLEHKLPNNEDVQLQKAMLYVLENRLNEAEGIARRFYRPGKEDLRPLRTLEEVAFRRKQPDQAISLVQSELAASERPVTRLMLGVAAFRARKLDLAIEEFRKVTVADPESPAAYYYLGQALARKGDKPGTLSNLKKAVELGPNNPYALLLYSQMLESAGNKPEAIPVYRRLLELQPDNLIALNNLAYLLAETGGNLDEAQSLVQRAIQKNPQQPNFSDTLGWIYYKKDAPASAIHMFENLVKKYPDNPSFRYHLGMTLIKSGDKQSARTELEEARSKKPPPEMLRLIDEALTKLG